MNEYTLLRTLDDHAAGKRYAAGAKIMLDAERARHLEAIGAISIDGKAKAPAVKGGAALATTTLQTRRAGGCGCGW